MKLWMSGEVWKDVADQHRNARKDIEKAVNEALSDNDYGTGVKEWAFLSIILPPNIKSDYPQLIRYNKREKIAECRMHIDLETFKSGDEFTHKGLIAEALLDSLRLLGDKNIPDFDHDRLKSDFEEIARQNGWL